MGDTSNRSGPERPDQALLGSVALHLDEGAVCLYGAAPKFGPAFQHILPQGPVQAAHIPLAGLDDALRAIFVPRAYAIIAHARKHRD